MDDTSSEPVPTSITATAAWRIVDAQLNRCAEGLRVVEEYLRMVLNDRHLAGQAKHLRHQLAVASTPLAASPRLAARDTLGDVGRETKTDTELERRDPWHVAQSSLSRVAQGLRVLEEYGKLLDLPFAQACERLRYQLYTLEKASGVTVASTARLEGVRLCALVDGRDSLDDFARWVRQLIHEAVGMIQLRDKRLNDKQLFARAEVLVGETRSAGVLAVVNDRADIAAAARADGVHLGQDDLPIAAARRLVGTGALVGRSTHSLEQARQAVLDGANYLGVGPTFSSATKSFDQFPGLELLRLVSAEIRLPAFAIGGIGDDNVADVLETGIQRIAVAGALNASGAAARLNEQLAGG